MSPSKKRDTKRKKFPQSQDQEPKESDREEGEGKESAAKSKNSSKVTESDLEGFGIPGLIELAKAGKEEELCKAIMVAAFSLEDNHNTLQRFCQYISNLPEGSNADREKKLRFLKTFETLVKTDDLKSYTSFAYL